jgi:1-acyl-sn-glycerol-3-phosphate acyltransferase
MIRSGWNYVVFALGIVLLSLICFAWALASWILWLVLPATKGRRIGRLGAMWGFRAFLAPMELLGAWRLDLRELDSLKDAGPLIVAPNHPGLLDAVLMVSRMPSAVCVMKGSLLGNFLLAPAARLARYVPNDSLLRLVTRAGDELRQGGQLLLFPEGTRTVGGSIGPLTEAVGAISKRTQVPVQAIIIEASGAFLGKHWPAWAPPPFPITFRARLGRRFEPPQDVRAFTEELDRHFRRELALRTPPAATSPGVEDAQQVRG